jgi:hypothetical protein
LDRGIDKLQVMDDSYMVINWMKGSLKAQNNSLVPLAQQLKAISYQFFGSTILIYIESSTRLQISSQRKDFIYLNFIAPWKKYMMAKRWLYNSFILMISELLLNL